MGAATTILIPDDLAARAESVPGLAERVVSFIRMEVTQHEQRQKRFRQETLELVGRASKEAERLRTEGFDREEAMTKFEERYRRLIGDEPA